MPPPSPPHYHAPDPNTYASTPLQQLSVSRHPPLMSHVLPDATRAPHAARAPLLPLQTYVMRNNRTFYDRGENTVFAPPVAPPPGGEDAFFEASTPLFSTTVTRDGSILGYVVRDIASDRGLLKIHFHGDTSNPFSRAFKAFVRSPVLKWDVENYGLFSDLPLGANLGLIQEVFPDNRVFFPSQAVSAMPRLEMQVAASLGLRYYLAVTGVAEPVGEVRTDVVGRFAPRSESYTMALRHCTREEAVLWLCMVLATDMKRRKSQNTRYGRSFLPVYL